jgi:hypothetical protein
MKQTAVEWLHELSKQRELDKFDWEQVKEMEKQQIIDAYQTSHISMMSAEQYYNETFKQD